MLVSQGSVPVISKEREKAEVVSIRVINWLDSIPVQSEQPTLIYMYESECVPINVDTYMHKYI